MERVEPLLKDPKSAKILELRTQMSIESENDIIFTFSLSTPNPKDFRFFLNVTGNLLNNYKLFFLKGFPEKFQKMGNL